MLGLNDSFVAQLTALDQSCGYAEYRNKYFKFPPPGIQPNGFFDYVADSACDVFDMANAAVSQVNPCFNIYHVSETCPLAPDVLGFNGITPGLPVYFDRIDVKAAMHAPDIEWSECSDASVFIGASGPDNNFQADTSLDPIQRVLPKVIEHTNRVLVSNGDLDMIIITNGTLLSIQNMTFHGKLGFQEQPSTPIIITEPDLQYGQPGSQGIMGIQHFERGLMWTETYQAGHMQPEYQPRASYRHIQWVLGRIEEL